MNREILFRGKRIDNGEWVEGNLLDGINLGVKLIQRWDDNLGYCLDEIIPETIGQYSGLKDKNGVKIFEGDIIELENYQGKKIRVVCKFGTARRAMYGNDVDITGFYFEYNEKTKTFPIVNNYAGKHDLELFEVIGNIYDDKEIKLEKPIKAKYGYVEACRFDEESGWMIEGGEEAYYEALKRYEESINKEKR